MWPLCYKCGMAKQATPLRIAIAASGRTISEVAEASGVERTKLSRIVNGLHADEATRDAIASVLGKHTDDLFPGYEQAAA